MPSEDPTRTALTIFRDSLRPKLQASFRDFSNDEIGTLRERELLGPLEDLASLRLTDPLTIISLLSNLEDRRVQLLGRQDAHQHIYLLNNIRHMRNDWAHFTLTSKLIRAEYFQSVARLLELSHDRPAAARVRKLLEDEAAAVRNRGRQQHAQATNPEIIQRGLDVAKKEKEVEAQQKQVDDQRRELDKQEKELNQHREYLDDREKTLEQETDALRTQLAHVESREQALERVPTPEDIQRRQQEIDSELAVLETLKQQYRQSQQKNAERQQQLDERAADLARRRAELEETEGEREQQADAARELSERLTDAVARLEQLQQIAQRPPALPEPAPEPVKIPAQTASESVDAPAFPCKRIGCRGQLERKAGKYGPFLGCNRFPRCHYTERLSDDPSAPAPDHGDCPDCRNPLIERHGRSGPFLGCSNYPRCRYTQSLKAAPEPAGTRPRR